LKDSIGSMQFASVDSFESESLETHVDLLYLLFQNEYFYNHEFSRTEFIKAWFARVLQRMINSAPQPVLRSKMLHMLIKIAGTNPMDSPIFLDPSTIQYFRSQFDHMSE